MKKTEDAELKDKSGLFLGSEPVDGVRDRRSYKMAGDDSGAKDGADKDAGDDDGTDSDGTDSDLTDKKDDSDSDGRD